MLYLNALHCISKYTLLAKRTLMKMINHFLDITLLLLLATMVVAVPHDVNQAWKEYKDKFSKGRVNLVGQDSTLRKEIFSRAHKMIVEHNTNGNRTFTLEHNMFSVMTEEEKKRYLGYVPPSIKDPKIRNLAVEEDVSSSRALSTPAELDYRSNACLGPIKSQRECGSCYAFAAVASLEFSNCLLNENKYVSLSEQQIVDCDTYNGGCGGGWPYNVWRYIQENNGIDTSSSYPYVSGSTGNQGTCKFNANAVAGNVMSYGQLPANDPVGMKSALVKYGVLMVGIAATGNFQSYKSGVYNDRSCDGNGRNHAVNIVGYGRDSVSGLDYWVLRNSWGSGWGQGGYMLIQRGVNKCDMESDVGYVVAVQKNPVSDVDNELRYIEAQYGTLSVDNLASKIFSEMAGSHPEYRWLSVVSPSGIDAIVVRAVRNPPQAFVHWSTYGNKHVLAFRHKTAPTNNPNVDSAAFANSVRNAFNLAQKKFTRSGEVLDEAKRIYSPIGNYQQVVLKTNQHVSWVAAGASFFKEYIGAYYVMLIELPNP